MSVLTLCASEAGYPFAAVLCTPDLLAFEDSPVSTSHLATGF